MGDLISFDSSTGKLTYRPAADSAGEVGNTLKIHGRKKNGQQHWQSFDKNIKFWFEAII